MFDLRTSTFALAICLNFGAPCGAQDSDGSFAIGSPQAVSYQQTYRSEARLASAAMVNIVRVVNSCEVTVGDQRVAVQCGVPAYHRTRWLSAADVHGQPEDLLEVTF